MKTVNIRWGTKFQISAKNNICARFPSEVFRPVRPSYVEKPLSCHPFKGVSPFHINTQQLSVHNSLVALGRYPSVTTVLGCTDEMEALYNWQKTLITQLGEAGFKKYVNDLLGSSITLHSIIAKLLKELGEKGVIASSDEEILEKLIRSDLVPCMRSILPFLRTLKFTRDCSKFCIEQLFSDDRLFYTGKFDAIVEINGYPTIVDWKKSSEPLKSNGSEKKSVDLYSSPIQIAAYIAAVNSSPKFSYLPRPLKHGAIIQIFNNGRQPNIIMIDEDEIKHYFELFLHRLNKFWYKIENFDEEAACKFVDFTYKPK